jgi:hypothetical protein
VIFDRVKSTKPEFRKTWLLQAMRQATSQKGDLVITNGKGRLFVQTLLPEPHEVRLVSGDDLYRYGGKTYPPSKDTGPAPECRVEIAPVQANTQDLFLHVLTAVNADVASVPRAAARVDGNRVRVELGDIKLAFAINEVGGEIELNGQRRSLATAVPSAP